MGQEQFFLSFSNYLGLLLLKWINLLKGSLCKKVSNFFLWHYRMKFWKDLETKSKLETSAESFSAVHGKEVIVVKWQNMNHESRFHELLSYIVWPSQSLYRGRLYSRSWMSQGLSLKARAWNSQNKSKSQDSTSLNSLKLKVGLSLKISIFIK